MTARLAPTLMRQTDRTETTSNHCRRPLRSSARRCTRGRTRIPDLRQGRGGTLCHTAYIDGPHPHHAADDASYHVLAIPILLLSWDHDVWMEGPLQPRSSSRIMEVIVIEMVNNRVDCPGKAQRYRGQPVRGRELGGLSTGYPFPKPANGPGRQSASPSAAVIRSYSCRETRMTVSMPDARDRSIHRLRNVSCGKTTNNTRGVFSPAQVGDYQSNHDYPDGHLRQTRKISPAPCVLG